MSIPSSTPAPTPTKHFSFYLLLIKSRVNLVQKPNKKSKIGVENKDEQVGTQDRSPPLLTRAARGFRPPAAARCPIPRTLRRPQSVQCGAPPARCRSPGAQGGSEGARRGEAGGGWGRARATPTRATPTRAGHWPPPAAAAGPASRAAGPISARGGSGALRGARSLARRARPNSGRIGLSAKSANSGQREPTARRRWGTRAPRSRPQGERNWRDLGPSREACSQ
nr:RNA-binding motif protein, X chromosome-like [Pan troglodytes]